MAKMQAKVVKLTLSGSHGSGCAQIWRVVATREPPLPGGTHRTWHSVPAACPGPAGCRRVEPSTIRGLAAGTHAAAIQDGRPSHSAGKGDNNTRHYPSRTTERRPGTQLPEASALLGRVGARSCSALQEETLEAVQTHHFRGPPGTLRRLHPRTPNCHPKGHVGLDCRPATRNPILARWRRSWQAARCHAPLAAGQLSGLWLPSLCACLCPRRGRDAYWSASPSRR